MLVYKKYTSSVNSPSAWVQEWLQQIQSQPLSRYSCKIYETIIQRQYIYYIMVFMQVFTWQSSMNMTEQNENLTDKMILVKWANLNLYTSHHINKNIKNHTRNQACIYFCKRIQRIILEKGEGVETEPASLRLFRKRAQGRDRGRGWGLKLTCSLAVDSRSKIQVARSTDYEVHEQLQAQI